MENGVENHLLREVGREIELCRARVAAGGSFMLGSDAREDARRIKVEVVVKGVGEANRSVDAFGGIRDAETDVATHLNEGARDPAALMGMNHRTQEVVVNRDKGSVLERVKNTHTIGDGRNGRGEREEFFVGFTTDAEQRIENEKRSGIRYHETSGVGNNSGGECTCDGGRPCVMKREREFGDHLCRGDFIGMNEGNHITRKCVRRRRVVIEDNYFS